MSLFAAALAALAVFGIAPSPISALPTPPPFPTAPFVSVDTADAPDRLAKADAGLRFLAHDIADPAAVDQRPVINTLYGLKAGDADPIVGLLVRLAPAGDAPELDAQGAVVHCQQDDLVYVTARVSLLPKLAALPDVLAISGLPATHLQTPAPRVSANAAPLARGIPGLRPEAFDHHGLTGKGVIVGFVGSGIDWSNPDFVNADGSSRILALYDLTDNSYAATNDVGSRPEISDAVGHPLGTTYVRKEITAALQNAATVNSYDDDGHGTACAGTAVGNGRAARKSGSALGMGVAPNADIVVVKTPPDQVDYLDAISWIFGIADERREPCVVMLNVETALSGRDGLDPGDLFLDKLVGAGKTGRVICVSMGNEGGRPIHGVSQFGLRTRGDAMADGTPVVIQDAQTGIATALMSHYDDWGLALTGDGFPGLDDRGIPVVLYISRTGQIAFETQDAGAALPKASARNLEDIYRRRAFVQPGLKTDKAVLILPPGKHTFWAYRDGPNVIDGTAHVYVSGPGFVTQGGDLTSYVDSPATASHVIAVGSLVAGAGAGASPFSSPGFRVDGGVKPDMLAPGDPLISPIAPGSAMAKDRRNVIGNGAGRYVAWRGSEAAAAFTTGVIALMLQKNPKLDAAQVRSILTGTALAKPDAATGVLPNPVWGNGRLRAEAAIVATPAAAPNAGSR